jgi:hypothetical protein
VAGAPTYPALTPYTISFSVSKGVYLSTRPISLLVIGFINRLQLVTTNNYNTVPDLHNVQSLHYNLLSLSLFPLVFTIRFLATDLNTGIITDSHFKYHCTTSLFITIKTAMPLFLHFMVHCYRH